VFTARYALSPYITQIRFVFKRLTNWSLQLNSVFYVRLNRLGPSRPSAVQRIHSSISNSKQQLPPAICDNDKRTDRPIKIFKINGTKNDMGSSALGNFYFRIRLNKNTITVTAGCEWTIRNETLLLHARVTPCFQTLHETSIK
jgi:hypothetical protein